MLGDKIKELRNKKGIYQQDLADALSVSKSTVAMWETNKREPDLEMIKKIADYFNISTDYLINWEEDKKPKFVFSVDPIKEFEMALVKLYPYASKDEIEKMKNINLSFGELNYAGLQEIEKRADEVRRLREYMSEDAIKQQELEWEIYMQQQEELKDIQESSNPSSKK